jgi:hypothetical protein
LLLLLNSHIHLLMCSLTVYCAMRTTSSWHLSLFGSRIGHVRPLKVGEMDLVRQFELWWYDGIRNDDGTRLIEDYGNLQSQRIPQGVNMK